MYNLKPEYYRVSTQSISCADFSEQNWRDQSNTNSLLLSWVLRVNSSALDIPFAATQLEMSSRENTLHLLDRNFATAFSTQYLLKTRTLCQQGSVLIVSQPICFLEIYDMIKKTLHYNTELKPSHDPAMRHLLHRRLRLMWNKLPVAQKKCFIWNVSCSIYLPCRK